MKHTFEIGTKDFLIDGKPTVLRCGEMHYARIPHPYWRHRLQMLKAMGCNAVATYDFWNLHEPQPGRWNFKGMADIAGFTRLAQQEGLWVMMRPGPYVCAEWELGGIPWWLLKIEDIKLRTQDPRYMAAVARYIKRFAAEIRPLLITNGGPIVLVQVENEYGSYGKDKEYILAIKQLWERAGINVPLFTADGPSQLWNGSRSDTFCGVNGGVGSLAELRRFRPSGPLIVTEYYPGWLSHWGEPFPRVGTAGIVRDVATMLSQNTSFNFYMAHGGTSFGLWAGANYPRFAPDTTSYDYNAPIPEAAGASEKFLAIREAIGKATGERLAPIPAPIPTVAVPSIRFEESARLWDHLPKPISASQPKFMESYNCGLGAILYRTTLPAGPEATLTLKGVHDIGQVIVGGEQAGVVNRRNGETSTVTIPARSAPRSLDLLVEALGRINYGGGLHDRKGITGEVQLDGKPLTAPWQVFPLPLEAAPKGLKFKRQALQGPGYYRATFNLSRAGDTYLDLRDWKRGMVWVNGNHLGRYWSIGPQQTLYCPGCWLKPGVNEIIVLAWEAPREAVISGLTEPILNDLRPETLPAQPHRKVGQNLSLVSLSTAWEGSLPSGGELHKVTFPAQASGRYLCLETLSNHKGDAFATLAELTVRGERDKALRATVIYADSEETEAEDGNANNIFDSNPQTFWHTAYSAGDVPQPHHLVLDLGSEVTITGVDLLPRQGEGIQNGRIKNARIYVRRDPFPGI
ncbi:MAG: beta-galactosidase [Armatimonas sp.]